MCACIGLLFGNSGAWAAGLQSPAAHIISLKDKTRHGKDGRGAVLVPDFFFCPSGIRLAAPNLTPDSPCGLGSATLGPLGENLPPSFD